MNNDKVISAIGELYCKEKYKFINERLLGEIVRDFVEEYKKL